MWFHFCFANHLPLGRLTLSDMFDWLNAGLKELGHEVTFHEYKLAPSAINILWEYSFPGLSDALYKSGCVYGLIGTEIPDGAGFNQRREPEWQIRWGSFQEVGANAAFIWSMVEDVLPFYSAFAPASFVELGFSKYLIPWRPIKRPRYDFVFFGLKTPYRIEIISKLEKYARIIWPERLVLPNEINHLIFSAKIGLLLKQSEEWAIPSPTRLARFIMARRGIAAERTNVITRQSEFIPIQPKGESFVEYALGQLHAPWKKQANESFKRFRDEMPMRVIMERLLDQTVYNNPRINRKIANKDDGKRCVLDIHRSPLLVEQLNNHNIVFYREKYYVVPHSLGPINIEEINSFKKDSVLYATDSLLTARKRATKLTKKIVEFKIRNLRATKFLKRLNQKFIKY